MIITIANEVELADEMKVLAKKQQQEEAAKVEEEIKLGKRRKSKKNVLDSDEAEASVKITVIR